MCYPYRPALRLGPVAAQSFYTSPRGGAYSWTTLSERLHPASSPTKDAFLGYRWSHSGSSIVRTCSRDWTMMKRTCTALFNNEPHASCRTIDRRLSHTFKLYTVSGSRWANPQTTQRCLQRHRMHRTAQCELELSVIGLRDSCHSFQPVHGHWAATTTMTPGGMLASFMCQIG